MENKPTEKQAYGMYITSLLIVGTIGVFRRAIPFSSGLLAFVRGLLGALSLVAFVKLRGSRVWHGTDRRKLLLLICTGVLLSFNWMLLFEAYTYTTVATATLCYYFQPTLVLLLSPLLFKEKLTAKKLICAALAVLGMVFVSGVTNQGGMAAGHLKGITCGLGAACFYAAVVILNKKISGVDAYEKTIVELIAAAFAMLPYLLLTEDLRAVRLDARLVVLLLIVGVVYTGLVYALYFGSMEALKAQSIAILSYLDPVVALLASASLLHERLSTNGVFGAVLILGAALLCEWQPEKKERSVGL
jgi:Predicted permeases